MHTTGLAVTVVAQSADATYRTHRDTLSMPRCGARTDHGRGPLCKNPVTQAGARCHLHGGLAAGGPRITKMGTRRTTTSRGIGDRPTRNSHASDAARAAAAREKRRRRRVEEAAEFCSELLVDGWTEAVASRATDYVTDDTMWGLLKRRRTKHCKRLARIAADACIGSEPLASASRPGQVSRRLGKGAWLIAIARLQSTLTTVVSAPERTDVVTVLQAAQSCRHRANYRHQASESAL